GATTKRTGVAVEEFAQRSIDVAAAVPWQPGRSKLIGGAVHDAPRDGIICNAGWMKVVSQPLGCPAREIARDPRTGLSVAGLDAFWRRIHASSLGKLIAFDMPPLPFDLTSQIECERQGGRD